MRLTLHHLAMFVLFVFVTISLVVPHVCIDHDTTSVKLEQSFKIDNTATKDHHNAKAVDDCCIAGHCCFAKILNSALLLEKTSFHTRAVIVSIPTNVFSSLELKTPDRPPKFFA